MLETIVCTISNEGTPRKNELVEQTMQNLAAMRKRDPSIGVRGAHLYGKGCMNNSIAHYCPEITFIPQPNGNMLTRPRKGMEALFSEIKHIVACAVREGPAAILYMEGDKPDFVNSIPHVVNPILQGSADVVVAARSERDFQRFPQAQRYCEGAANRTVANITGTTFDRMYGPRAWSAETAHYFSEALLGDFSALTLGIVLPELLGKRVVPIVVPGTPQEKYMNKYSFPLRVPGLHFLYRALQNGPHQSAALLAKQMATLEKKERELPRLVSQSL